MKLSSLTVKIKNAFTYALHLILFLLLKPVKTQIKPGTILLIRLDAIGDYILVRNFIRHLRYSLLYKDSRITLCGNILWKELAETLDSDAIDEFLWLDRRKFSNSIIYKFNFLKDVKHRGFETSVEITFSREILFGDTIIKASSSPVRIGSTGSPDSHVKWKRSLFSDKYYTKLIPAEKDNIFEFYWNKKFFKQAFGIEVPDTIAIDTEKIEIADIPKNKFVVLFPGASRTDKIWNIKNYRVIADYILNNYPYDIVVSGSSGEKEYAGGACPVGMESRFTNLCGKPLSYLPGILSIAELLISNDTSAVHFAAAVNTPFICIVNGFSFGRFYPYPEEIFPRGYYIYPDGFTPGKIADVNNILPSDIIPVISDKLNIK